jgi:6-phosphogluconate dehydrogenase
MPGSNKDAWSHVEVGTPRSICKLELAVSQDVLQSISAKFDGEACCQRVGDGGAGHYVKMVHGRIEYGAIQLICKV